MGCVGISYQEIEAWMRLTGVNLTPWESETVMKMSATYARVLSTASDKGAVAPPEVDQSEVDRTAQIVNKIFG